MIKKRLKKHEPSKITDQTKIEKKYFLVKLVLFINLLNNSNFFLIKF